MTTGIRDHVDPLTAMLYPAYTKRCDHCGGFVAMSPEEALSRALEAAYQPWASMANAMQPGAVATGAASTQTPVGGDWAAGLMQGWGSPGHHQKHHHGHHHHHGDCGCGCRDCERDDCHCRCCVVNAELVVNTRLGERRIVPLTLENNRRREREVKLELSDFSSKGGSDSGVSGELLSPAEFTLAACEEREILIGINVGGGDQQSGDKDTTKKEQAARTQGSGSYDRLPDVDECRVAYGNLRVVGCDIRPIRIAVATLPRDCHDYRIDCACGCC